MIIYNSYFIMGWVWIAVCCILVLASLWNDSDVFWFVAGFFLILVITFTIGVFSTVKIVMES